MGEKDEAKNEVEKKGSDGADKAAPVVDGGQPEKGPVTVVLKMDLHCEGCAKKVKRSISYLQGVEKVKAECDAKKLTIIGNNIDPSWIREKVEQKSNKKVELISPQPKKSDDIEKVKAGEEEKPKEVVVRTIVMKIRLHCAGCANKIKRIILKNIYGVNSVTTTLDKDLVTVIGTMDIQELISYLKEKLKRGVEIIPPQKKDEDKKENEKIENKKDEKKESGEDGDKKAGDRKPKENKGEETKNNEESKGEEEPKESEVINNKMENLSFNPQTYYAMPMHHYQDFQGGNNQDYGMNVMYHNYNNRGYYPNTNYFLRYEHGPPLPPPPTYLSNANGGDHNMLSDENPNGCVVM